MTSLRFRTRRLIALAVTLFAVFVVWFIAWLEESRLGHAAYFTGITCLSTLLLLVLLGVRRRIPVLPLGSVSTWTQIHIYTGLFATAVYIMHVPALVAGGMFEFSLSLLFWLVSASGFYGLYASRSLPKRLTAVEGQHRFDRVAWHRDQIASLARQLLETTSEQSTIRVLGAYYTTCLKPFFGRRPTLGYVIVPTGARRRRLLSGLQELDRYLESDGRATAGRFAALVRRRDDLDYQYALQLRLRIWVLVHSVFSLALVLAAVIHAVMAWHFTG
jgi:hypothetical protein